MNDVRDPARDQGDTLLRFFTDDSPLEQRFRGLAEFITGAMSRDNSERKVALRRLLEAQDAALRAAELEPR